MPTHAISLMVNECTCTTSHHANTLEASDASVFAYPMEAVASAERGNTYAQSAQQNKAQNHSQYEGITPS